MQAHRPIIRSHTRKETAAKNGTRQAPMRHHEKPAVSVYRAFSKESAQQLQEVIDETGSHIRAYFGKFATGVVLNPPAQFGIEYASDIKAGKRHKKGKEIVTGFRIAQALQAVERKARRGESSLDVKPAGVDWLGVRERTAVVRLETDDMNTAYLRDESSAIKRQLASSNIGGFTLHDPTCVALFDLRVAQRYNLSFLEKRELAEIIEDGFSDVGIRTLELNEVRMEYGSNGQAA